MRLFAIIVNYGTPIDTIASLQSLSRSRRAIDHFVIVDNGSGDDSVERFLTELPFVTVLQNDHNLGFSQGCNRGITWALAQGADLILLANSDVSVDPECIEQLERALLQLGRFNLGIVGPLLLRRSDPLRIESRGIQFSTWTGRMWNRGAGSKRGDRKAAPTEVVDGVSGCLMLVRRSVFERVGLFDADYFFSFEDLDLCLRAYQSGFRTACVESAVAYHEGSRTIGAKSSRRVYFATRNHLLLERRAAPRSPLGPLRPWFITLLNLMYVMTARNTRLGAGFAAFGQGLFDHILRRYGNGP